MAGSRSSQSATPNVANTSRCSPPRAMAAPSAAMNVSRGMPSASAQADQTRVSSMSVSPTSRQTQRRPAKGCVPLLAVAAEDRAQDVAKAAAGPAAEDAADQVAKTAGALRILALAVQQVAQIATSARRGLGVLLLAEHAHHHRREQRQQVHGAAQVEAALGADAAGQRVLAVAEHVAEDPRAVRGPRVELRGAVEVRTEVVDDRPVVVLGHRLLQAAAAVRLLAERGEQRRHRRLDGIRGRGVIGAYALADLGRA